MKQQIHFGGDSWHAGRDKDCEMKAKDFRVPRPLRAIEAAKSRANIWGHAAFRPGELADWLTDENGKPARNTVWRAIKQAVAWGYLAPGSTAECLVLNRAYYTRGYGRAEGCFEAAHRDVRYLSWHAKLGWTGWEWSSGYAPPEDAGFYVADGQAFDARTGEVIARQVEPAASAYRDLATGIVFDIGTGEVIEELPSAA
jgi:hypothetical protein